MYSNMMGLEQDCYEFMETHKGRAFTTLTKTIRVPNMLIQTLDNAAEESKMTPAPKRGQKSQSPVRIVTMTSMTSGLADRRRERLFRSRESVLGSLTSSEEEEVSTKVRPKRKVVLKEDKHDLTKSFKDLHIYTEQKNSQESPVSPPTDTSRSSTPLSSRSQMSPNNGFFNKFQPGKVKKPMPTAAEKRACLSLQANIELMKGPSHVSFHPSKNECCCNRPKATVWCKFCGFNVKGNVRVVCPMHPQKSFLYDWEVCGNRECRAPNHLIETNM